MLIVAVDDMRQHFKILDQPEHWRGRLEQIFKDGGDDVQVASAYYPETTSERHLFLRGKHDSRDNEIAILSMPVERLARLVRIINILYEFPEIDVTHLRTPEFPYVFV